MTTTWVTWEPRGRDLYSNPRAKRAHAIVNAGPNASGNLRVGQFPLACGRWAPDGWDALIEVNHRARRCAKCEKVVARMEAAS